MTSLLSHSIQSAPTSRWLLFVACWLLISLFNNFTLAATQPHSTLSNPHSETPVVMSEMGHAMNHAASTHPCDGGDCSADAATADCTNAHCSPLATLPVSPPSATPAPASLPISAPTAYQSIHDERPYNPPIHSHV